MHDKNAIIKTWKRKNYDSRHFERFIKINLDSISSFYGSGFLKISFSRKIILNNGEFKRAKRKFKKKKVSKQIQCFCLKRMLSWIYLMNSQRRNCWSDDFFSKQTHEEKKFPQEILSKTKKKEETSDNSFSARIKDWKCSSIKKGINNFKKKIWSLKKGVIKSIDQRYQKFNSRNCY